MRPNHKTVPSQPDPPLQVWQELELTFLAQTTLERPYTEVEFWAEFDNESGTRIERPGFWAGGETWRLRFVSPGLAGAWTFRTRSSPPVPGLDGESGRFEIREADSSADVFTKRGFWRMSPGGRNLVHADGTPTTLIADTAWALPWRATLEEVEVYARDRSQKGFNAVLMMTLQPDREAVGPRDRSADGGFAIAFEDLPNGELKQMNSDYFEYFDAISATLIRHGLVPVLQPVFFGYGWKGGGAAGPIVTCEDYARYCRYLVARYGARPAIYLVSADGQGEHPQVAAGGEEIQRVDAYGQPTGIHYCPHAKNQAHQNAEWLDFQWCQTGHMGEHLPERVADMWRNLPAKGVANGEPTYENIGETGRACDWWQGHEAWSNLCSGGTMGVVYGAGSLWQWKHRADEPGHPDWCSAPDAGWREALDFPGSAHVGRIGKILAGLPLSDIEPNWVVTLGKRGLYAPGKLLITYLSTGGDLTTLVEGVPLNYRVVDPVDGSIVAQGRKKTQDERLCLPTGRPLVCIFCADE